MEIPARKATAPLTTVCARVVTFLRRTGANAEAAELLGHLREILTHVDNLGPRRKAFLHQMFSQEAFHAGEYGVMVAELEQSIRGFESAGDYRWSARDHANVGYAYLLLGVYDVAELELCAAKDVARRIGVDFMARVVDHNLAIVRLRQGRIDEARELEARAVAAFEEKRSLRLLGFSKIYQARIELRAERPDEALEFARQAVEVLSAAVPSLEPYALAAVSRSQLARGETDDAVATAARAMQLMSSRGRADEGEPFVHLAQVLALKESGQRQAAAAAVRAARERLLERGAVMDATLRDSFLSNVPENSGLLSLAAELLGQT